MKDLVTKISIYVAITPMLFSCLFRLFLQDTPTELIVEN